MEYIDVMINNQSRRYPLHTIKLLNTDWDETGADVFIEYPSFAIVCACADYADAGRETSSGSGKCF
jgi:hypothetical protein